MSQLDNKKSPPPANEKSTSSPSEMKLEGSQKVEAQKTRTSVLPPEDLRLRYMVVASQMRELTLLEKVKGFLARLFGQ